jgi:hypothetical protein
MSIGFVGTATGGCDGRAAEGKTEGGEGAKSAGDVGEEVEA